MIVMVERWTGGPGDAHGNVSDSWSAPEPLLVFGWAPAGSGEPKAVGANRLTVDVELLAPEPLHHKDRVIIDGERFEVDGEPGDWRHGPFGFAPGVAINLRRA